MKIKLRGVTKHFVGKNEAGGVLVQMRFCIEVWRRGKWRLLGDDSGPYKFNSSVERDDKLAELRTDLAGEEAEL